MPKSADDEQILDDQIDLEDDDQTLAVDTGDDEEGEGSASPETEDEDSDAGDEQLVITLGDGDESDPEDEKAAPPWVKDLRKENRAKDRRIRDLERQINTSAAPAAPVVGPKPTLEASGGDQAKYETDFEAWSQRKAVAESAAREQQAAAQKVTERWQQHLASVEAEERRMGLAKPDEARETFESTFSIMQQAIVLEAAKDSRTAAMLRYALGRNTAAAERVRAIESPVKFAVAIGDLMRNMKATKKSAPPAPERRPSPGSAPGSAVDNNLDKLRKEAEKSGNLTKLLAFKTAKKRARA